MTTASQLGGLPANAEFCYSGKLKNLSRLSALFGIYRERASIWGSRDNSRYFDKSKVYPDNSISCPSRVYGAFGKARARPISLCSTLIQPGR